MKSVEIDALSDQELEILNDLLPWASFVQDSSGRNFGKPFSDTKRSVPKPIPDRRIKLLNQEFDLSDKKVLEIGCFEGIHTAGLANYARQVVGVDARIENVIKTLVRLWAYRLTEKSDVFLWNVEEEPHDINRIECDILHHVGVLYHLADPVRHLNFILPKVSRGVILDTHVATEKSATKKYTSTGKDYRYQQYDGEAGRKDPFSGLYDHSKWLLEKDLIEIFEHNNFSNIKVIERRDERNGLRVLLLSEK